MRQKAKKQKRRAANRLIHVQFGIPQKTALRTGTFSVGDASAY